MLKVGVAGVGHLGRLHARVYSELDSCDFVGVHDTDGERAASVAAEFGGSVYEKLDDLIGAVDALSVVVPTTAHRDVAVAAMERGVHALVEKPIASTLDEGRELVAAAGRNGVVLQVGHIERFGPAMRAAAGRLDSPLFVEAHRLGVFVPRGTDVAVVLDLMIHDIDLVLSVVRSPVVRVDAVGVPVLSPTVDIANARIAFESGCVANLTASRVSREKVRKIRFFQRDAYISVDSLRPRAQLLKRRDLPLEYLHRIASGEVEGGLEDVVDFEELPLDDSEPLKLELDSFVAAAAGESEPLVTGADGVRSLEVALEVMRQIG
jgi:predicted dehydrogenase